MVVLSSPQKKVGAGDKKADFAQVEAAAMTRRNVHVLQRRRRARSDGSALSPLARRGKDKRGLIRRGGAIVMGNWPTAERNA